MVDSGRLTTAVAVALVVSLCLITGELEEIKLRNEVGDSVLGLPFSVQ